MNSRMSPIDEEMSLPTISEESSTSPSQLQETFDTTNNGAMPFTMGVRSPGKTSPLRGRTMKEYEEQLNSLSHENFSLKLRIYFLEERMAHSNNRIEEDEDASKAIELKVETEMLRKDLATKQNLLCEASRALDLMEDKYKTKMNIMSKQQEEEITQLQSRIIQLTKELEEAKAFNNPELFANAFDLAINKCVDHHSHEEVEQLTKQIEHLKNEVEKLDEETRSQTARANHFEDEAAAQHSECERSAAKSGALEVEVRERDSRLADLALELEQRVHDLAESNRRVRELEDALSAKEPEIQIKVQELYARDRLIEEKQSQIDQQNKVLVEIQITLDEKKREIEALRQSLASRDSSITELESRLAKAKSSIRTLESKLDSVSRENQRLLDEVADLKAHQRLLSSQQTAMDVLASRTRRSSASSDEGASSARIRHLERLVKEGAEKFALLERCKCEQEAALKKSEAEHAKALQAIQTFLKRVKDLNKSLDNLKTEVKIKDRQLTEVTCELRALRDANNKAEWEKHQREAELRGVPIPGAFSDVRDMADEENEGLWAELENKNHRLAQLMADKEAISSQLETLKQNLKEKAQLLEESLRKIQTQEKIIAELYKRNSSNKLDILQHVHSRDEAPEKDKPTKEGADSPLQQLTLVPVPQTVINQQFIALPQISDSSIRDQLLTSTEERLVLSKKVEELRERIRNTPERDSAPSLKLELNQLREDYERANEQRQEALQACGILIKRLEELSRFLQSLLRNRDRLLLDKRRRDMIMLALDKSMELSRRLTISFTQEPDGSLSHLGSLAGLLHSVDETEMSLLELIEPNMNTTGSTDLDIKSQVQLIAQKLNLPEAETSLQMNHLTIEDEETLLEPQLSASLAAIEPAVFVDAVTGHASQSESEAWSEPDRNVSLARIGLPEDVVPTTRPRNVARTLIMDQSSCSSEDTANESQRTPGKRLRVDANEIRRMQNRIRALEQLNETLHNELNIFQQFSYQSGKPNCSVADLDNAKDYLSTNTSNQANLMEDKATCTSLTIAGPPQASEPKELVLVSTHILEEIRYQREKLESFLTHNEFIRRHLEDVCRSIKEGDTASNLLAKIKETTEQLEELQDKNQQLEEKLIKTTTELEQSREKENRINLTVKELEETKEKVVLLQQQIGGLEMKIKEKDNEIIEQQCRLLELENSKKSQSKQAVEQIQAIRQDLETRLQVSQVENETLVAEQTKLRAEIAERVAQVERLVLESAQQKEETENQLKNFQQELTKKDEEMQSRQWECIAEAERKIREAEKLGKQFEDGIKRHEEEQRGKTIAFNTIKVHNEKLEKQLRRYEEDASHSASQIAIEKSKLLNEKLKLEQQVRQLTGKMSALTHEKQQAESEHVLDNVKLEKTILELEHQKSDLQAQVTELEATNSQLEHQIAQLRFRDHSSFGGLSPPRRHHRLSPPPISPPGPRPLFPTLRSPLTIPSLHISSRSHSQQSNLSGLSGYQSQRSPSSPTHTPTPLWANVNANANTTHQQTTLGSCASEPVQVPQPRNSTGSARNNRLVRQRSDMSDSLSEDQQTDEYETVFTQTSSYWVTLSANGGDLTHRGNNSSPDLGIESDQGRFSSLEAPRPMPVTTPDQMQTTTTTSLQANQTLTQTQTQLTQQQSVQGDQVDPLDPSLIGRLERENEDLKRKLLRTRRTLEETLSQLQSSNQRKRLIDKAITKQLHKTQDVLKITKEGLTSTSE